MILPTDPAVLVAIATGRSGWSGYDRTIRDNLASARPTDPWGQTYWWYRALTCAHLGLLGQRYNGSLALFRQAQRAAIASLRPFANAQALDDVQIELDRYAVSDQRTTT